MTIGKIKRHSRGLVAPASLTPRQAPEKPRLPMGDLVFHYPFFHQMLRVLEHGLDLGHFWPRGVIGTAEAAKATRCPLSQ